MDKNSRIFVAGHGGMVGSAMVRRLQSEGYNNLLLRKSSELDLRNQSLVDDFFKSERPQYVILAAARVGGILANDRYRADFLYDNLMIESNVIHHSYLNGVQKLLFMGSSCIYPKMAPQPLKEEYLLSGFLERTNEPYAIAKIAGIKLCENYRAQYNCNFISVMPSNLYGPNDNYDLNNSHVLPSLVRKFIEARTGNKESVEVWGSGNPLREFLHVDDLADACLLLMLKYNEASFINVGTGEDISIRNLAELVKKIVGFTGEIRWDSQKPDGTPRKVMDVSNIHKLNWRPKISLEDGIGQVVRLFEAKNGLTVTPN